MFRYTDWTGKRKQKKASGFSTKREALAFERDFMEQEAGSPSMTFANLWAIYKRISVTASRNLPCIPLFRT